MRFVVKARLGQRPVLFATGRIDDELIPRLRAAINSFPGDEIWLHSAGGNVDVGRQAAYLLRRSNMITRIPAGWACRGACAYMFMGGFARTVEAGGLFIVQPVAAGNHDPEAAARAAAARTVADSELLIRMGISRTLLSEVLSRTEIGEQGQCLSAAELDRYNVTNLRSGVPKD